MRIYRPSTEADLAALADGEDLPASAESVVAPDDDEETEYAALMTAADASAALADGAARRVVVVAEVGGEEAPVRLRDVVALHVDATPGADPDDDLEWWAPTEIRVLLDGG